MKTDQPPPWEPPWALEERLKFALVPTSLYMRYRAGKERRRGEPEVALLPFLADPERVSVDVGANKGVYTWFLKDCSRLVHAYEPNPKMFRFLRRLASDRVLVSPIAMSDETGPATLLVPRHGGKGYSNQGASLSAIKVAGEHRGVPVQASRLDDLGIADVGFIKIDVEGFELAVLEGARQTIARDRPAMLIEIEEIHTRQPIEDAIGWIEAMGYRCLFLERGVLRPIERFDADRHHRHAKERRDYVFNFIFLPRG